MQLEAFKALAADAQAQVEVLAIDPMIYLLRCTGGAAEGLLERRRGGNWQFPSLAACRRFLQEAGIRSAVLVHESAYGEMIGSADDGSPHAAAATQLRVPLVIPAPETR